VTLLINGRQLLTPIRGSQAGVHWAQPGLGGTERQLPRVPDGCALGRSLGRAIPALQASRDGIV